MGMSGFFSDTPAKETKTVECRDVFKKNIKLKKFDKNWGRAVEIKLSTAVCENGHVFFFHLKNVACCYNYYLKCPFCGAYKQRKES